MKITVSWEVEDGYVGQSRPQTTEIDIDDDEWENMTGTEREEYIEEEVKADFETKIGFNITNKEFEKDDE